MRIVNKGLTTALLAGTALLSVAGVVNAQTVNLTAARQTTTLPDGNTVPMWGWVCGAAASGASCTQTNGSAQTGGATWQPPLITVPYVSTGTALTITLTNNLPVPTSLTIVGQLPSGDVNGLGNPSRESGRPAHATQTETTWVARTPGTFTPPAQATRASSFVQEAAANTGTITYSWTNLRPGTYLIETGSYPSIQGPMGLYGVLVVSNAPVSGTAFAAGTASYVLPGATSASTLSYDGDGVMVMSEIDSVQNNAVELFLENAAVAACPVNTGVCPSAVSAAAAMKTWSLACSTNGPAATANTCYPPAVDFTPTYFLVNGRGFDRTNPAASAVNMGTTASSGNVLLRLVNAGLRMHVPSVSGLNTSLIAEDGNIQPDTALWLKMLAASPSATPPGPKTQNDWLMPAGKALDLLIKPAASNGSYASAYYMMFDRALSLSNGNQRDGGMQSLLVLNGGVATLNATGAPTAFANITLAPGLALTAQAVADNFIVPVGATTFSGNVLANDTGITGATLVGTLTGLTLSPNGAFTYAPGGAITAQTFQYCGNGATNPAASPTLCATVTLTPAQKGGAPVAVGDTYTSNVATMLKITAPGVLANDSDPTGYPLTAVFESTTCQSVLLNQNGSFTAAPVSAGSNCSFSYHAVNSQGTASSSATVTLNFLSGNGLKFNITDAVTGAPITDYKWVIEQDLTFKIDPACQQNGTSPMKPANCPSGAVPPTLGTNFHTSYMPMVASGCTDVQSCERGQTIFDPTTGTHVPAVCTAGVCVPGTAATVVPPSSPSDVHLAAFEPDGLTPARYYISILPGDSANAFNVANSSPPVVGCENNSSSTAAGQSVPPCGHTMGGGPIPPAQSCTTTAGVITCAWAPNTAVNVAIQRNPMQTATLTVFVFEDDAPLNGEHDAGGNNREPGLGDFQVEMWDDQGGSGDASGQMTYDMFNNPLSNSLNGTVDPLTGQNACPIAPTDKSNTVAVGMIVVCPQYEADGVTPSPLAGTAVVRNLMPGRFGIIVHPSAAREARGEEWIQTNTLDGTHFLDSFLRSGEPAYFQEWGPGGWHVFMGMANPQIINNRKAFYCNGAAAAAHCNTTVNGQVASLHMSRPPNESLYSSNVFAANDSHIYDPLAHTTCWASLGDPDGDDFMFTKCDAQGRFTFQNVPDGNWSLKVGDQWLDLIIDGSSKPVNVSNGTCNGQTSGCMINYPAFTWQTHIWTNTYLDENGNGIQDGTEAGLLQVPNRIRMRDGKINNTQLTDVSGHAHFDETFPLFNWYVIESDNTRFKNTGVHVVYDAGGALDGPAGGGGNGNTSAYQGILSSKESFPLPNNLRVPGAVYCATAECTDVNLGTNPNGGGLGGSTGRIDPGSVVTEGFQGYISQYEIIEWGKQPYAAGENGGIRGHVVYSSTRPFDDPSILFQNLWEPLVPNVTINLYAEGAAPDGTTTLTLIDTTKTSSWDNWVQGFRADGVTPNVNCPGQDPYDQFFSYTLLNTPNFLTPATPLPNNSQYKCYDGLHAYNQVQPAPYDGLYQFPSAAYVAAHPLTTQQTAAGQTLVSYPPGKYVVEVVVPPGYELTKEEDKNILIGDAFIAPAALQFPALGSIFIVPDQASINSYNQSYTGPINGTPAYASSGAPCPNGTSTPGAPCGNNGNPTTNMGRTSVGGFGPGGLTTLNTPCVGQKRIVPDYMSISPESGQVAPFAGALRPMCDRKEVTLQDQMQAQTDFFVWTQTPAATHFTGFILDDFSSEFDPAAPGFGEKFAVPNLPISIRDFNGHEVSRTYSDQWGIFNGMVYSTWEVNPPNPTGYSPNMMVTCMNDPGPLADPRPACTGKDSSGNPTPYGCSTTSGQTITDPWYNPAYSNFCYENPFMPGDTTYLDTPVVPTSAFAEGYNSPDCAYPDAVPSIKSVVSSDAQGPWVSAAGAGHTLTITALGDVSVPNHAYSGPAASTAPWNMKTITRHYGFGATQGTGTVAVVDAAGASHPLTNVSWNDTMITGTVPTGVGNCPGPVQNGQPAAQCGELVITTASGKRSVDTVTVTIGGKAPIVVAGENPTNNAIQSAIDATTTQPGDLILVQPGTYTEMVLMWKPVRLQGVGAASVTINGNSHPAGRIDPWRRKINCLFGLALNGTPMTSATGTNPYDPTSQYSSECTPDLQGQSDPIPLEPLIGWSSEYNGNLSQLLIEPTLAGAYEGAGITVLGKGLQGTMDATGTNNIITCAENGLPCTLLDPSNSPNDPSCSPTDANYFVGNFSCNPSRIDGMTITNSSQGGGGVFVHGWNHNLVIANTHINGNAGTISGGINLGMPEVPDVTFTGATNHMTPVPFGFNRNVLIQYNSITFNSSYGDELNSTTPMAAGGVSISPGADNYVFQHNWVCGNMSDGDGGGFTHFGMSFPALIQNNAFLFNQSNNPTIPTHGGGVAIMGAPPDATLSESSLVDIDAAPNLSDGIGPGIVFNANLVLGNSAESGSGGGLRLQLVNGTDIANNPTNPNNWNNLRVTNNVFSNNVAGWGGGGVSMQDAVMVDFVNNTVVSNDSTSSAGVLFDTLGAANANNPPPGCNPQLPEGAPLANGKPNNCTQPITTSQPEVAGVETHPHSVLLAPAFAHTPAGACPAGRTNCNLFSNPLLYNNIIWHNRTFNISVDQTNHVALMPVLSQASTGACSYANGVNANFWDIGVYGDTSTAPGSGSPSMVMNPMYSILSSTTGYNASNKASNPSLVGQYCNGPRVPPEIASLNGGALCAVPPGQSGNGTPGCVPPGAVGLSVPPGIPDINPTYVAFSLTPTATVDEGNNWINLFFGPLSMVNASIAQTAAGYNTPLVDPHLSAGSSAIGAGASSSAESVVPPATRQLLATDFYGNGRPASKGDIGAVQQPSAVASVTGGPLLFGPVMRGTTSPAQTLTLHNTGNADLTGITLAFSSPVYSRPAGAAGGTCGTTLTPADGTCTINVVFSPIAVVGSSGNLTITANVPVSGSPVFLSGNGTAVPPPTVSITPNPLTITLPTLSVSGTGTVALKNTAPVGGPNVTISAVTVSGGNFLTWYFNKVLGADNCQNATLAPGASCTVGVRFTNVTSPRGVDRAGTIIFVDNATGSPQTVNLVGHAN